jgi:hypothetical protein
MRMMRLGMAAVLLCGASGVAAQTYDCVEMAHCSPQHFELTAVACNTPVGSGSVGALSVTVNDDGTGRLDYAFDPDVLSFPATVTEGDGMRWLVANDADQNRALALHFTGQAMLTLTDDSAGNFLATALYYQCTRRAAP